MLRKSLWCFKQYFENILRTCELICEGRRVPSAGGYIRKYSRKQDGISTKNN